MNTIVADLVILLYQRGTVLADLLYSINSDETHRVNVDLRGNTGGDSRFVFHLAYVLQGWEGVTRTIDSIRSLKRRTEVHRERYGPGDNESEDTPADYDFSDFLDDPESKDGEPEPQIREHLMRSATFAEVVETGSHEAAYQPAQIVVAVSASTLSSAFAGAAQLTSLGAEIVGVPSGQAPLSFGEPIKETLPNTGLSVRIASAMYHWIPDPDTNVLQPDRELTPALFERYGRTADAGLRLAFDNAGITEPSDDPPEPSIRDSTGK